MVDENPAGIMERRKLPGGPAMDIPVLLERVAGDGYRARGLEPFPLTAEGSTRDEALQRLRDLIAQRIPAGAELVSLCIPTTGHPWASFAGDLKDDPLLESWKEAMADYRRQMDDDPDVPRACSSSTRTS
jgi:hypothetical protein